MEYRLLSSVKVLKYFGLYVEKDARLLDLILELLLSGNIFLLVACFILTSSSLIVLVIFMTELSSSSTIKSCGLINSQLQLDVFFYLSLLAHRQSAFIASSVASSYFSSSTNIFIISVNDFASFSNA